MFNGTCIHPGRFGTGQSVWYALGSKVLLSLYTYMRTAEFLEHEGYPENFGNAPVVVSPAKCTPASAVA